MRGAPRRGVHQSDLPLRLTIDETGRRCFGYLIVRNDGTVALASSRLFATEAAARVADYPCSFLAFSTFGHFSNDRRRGSGIGVMPRARSRDGSASPLRLTAIPGSSCI
jgi:hypothetical protein